LTGGLAYLFDERGQETDDLPELFFLQRLIRRQQAEHVHELVVHGVVLASKLAEEHPTHVSYSFIAVFDALGHLAQLTLDLYLSGKDQERQGHQTGPLDRK